MKAVSAFLVWVCFTIPAYAQEFVTTDRLLGDTNFYRLVACAAQPGGPCQKDNVRWPESKARNLRVSLYAVDQAFDTVKRQAADRALDHAIAQINAAGAAIRLVRVPDRQPSPIRVHLRNVPSQSNLRNTGIHGLDGMFVDFACVHIWWDDVKRINRAEILITRDLQDWEYRSVFLEELVQSLGLLTDIGGPVYQNLSIFAQDANVRTTLGRQDIIALRRHYPR